MLVLLEQMLVLLDLQNHDRHPLLVVLVVLLVLRSLCRRLGDRLHRALAVLPLISVRRF
jgi:hypothetical protein